MKGSLTRTLATFLLLSILLLILSVGICYYTAYQDARAQAITHATELLSDTVQSIAMELADVMTSAQMLANESSLNQFVTADATGRFEQKEFLQALLKYFTDFKPLVIRTLLYTKNNTALLSGAQDTNVYSTLLYTVFLQVKSDYELLTPYPSSVLTRCYFRDDNTVNFAILTPVFAPVAAPSDADYLGSLVILCDMAKIGEMMPEGTQRKMLLTQNGELLYANNAAFQPEDTAGKDVISLTVPGTDWELYATITPVNLGSQLSGVLTVCIVVCTVAMLAQLLLLLALRRAMIIPIIHIANQTDAIGDSSLAVHNPSSERNEMTRLTNGINDMLVRIHQLNEQMLTTRLKLYQERVMFLQGQMNPHFLYNNLACIRGMAGKGNDDGIRKIAGKIASIYRYCAQNSPVVHLHEELDCVKMYEEVYQLRWSDNRFSLVFYIDPEALFFKTPRMFLQPLVENAFEHAYGKAKEGVVQINASCQGDVLILHVIDHGAGMPADIMAHMNNAGTADEKAMTGHLGLLNVSWRIQIIFGSNAAIRFSDTPGGGLTVTVTLPQKDVIHGEI